MFLPEVQLERQTRDLPAHDETDARARRKAILGNAGTLISFRVGPTDTELLAKEMSPEFEPEDLMRLPNYKMYLKMMVEHRPTRPFSAENMMARSPSSVAPK
jgi:hypothetical protein